MESCLIAQISDLHISSLGKAIYDNVDSLANLKTTVSKLNDFKPHIDAVLISGDLAHDASESAYTVIFEVLAELNMPFYVVPGNHDSRAFLRKQIFEHQYLMSDEDRINWMVTDYPVNLVGLDSMVEGQDHGLLSKDSLDFLARCLQGQQDKPAMIMLHHPPVCSGIKFMDDINLKNAQELESVIRPHKQVLRVTCGHLHRSMQTHFANKLLTVCPSSSHQMKLVLEERPNQFSVESSVQFLLHQYKNGKLNTHQITI